jgi:2-keto-3-deoxy-6-phosphogluconate aldolase
MEEEKMKKVLFVGLVCVGFFSSVVFGGKSVEAAVAYPHPHYKDTWEYGVTKSNYAYSYYYLEAPVRLGSYTSVTDAYGNVKSRARSNYGWARAGAQKQWYLLVANSYYDWYNF